MSKLIRGAFLLAPGLLALGLGCAQPGPLGSRLTMVGTLKTSVAQLEHEKELLKKEVAELRSENRRVGERLAQEEETNGELTARLDDARNLIGRQGGDGSSLADTSIAPVDVETPRRARTSPAGRPQKKGRKVPFAEIPHRSNEASAPEPADDPAYRSGWNEKDLGAQSRNDRPAQWLPIASGVSSSKPTKVR